MPGTFNGKTLVISATPTAGAKIVDAGAATNVAGITISGDTMYSVKTSGKVTTLYNTRGGAGGGGGGGGGCGS